MTTSTSRLAYDDVIELLERAVSDGVGCRIKFDKRPTFLENRGDAYQYRNRIHYARKLDREANKEIYQSGHPLYGRSQYDIFSASIRTEDGEVYIYLEKRTINSLKIEDLSQIEIPRELEYSTDQQKLIESPEQIKRRI